MLNNIYMYALEFDCKNTINKKILMFRKSEIMQKSIKCDFMMGALTDQVKVGVYIQK